MNLQATTTNGTYTTYVVGNNGLPCVFCGRAPQSGDTVIEINSGHPRLLCGDCVRTALHGFEDLYHMCDDYPTDGR